MLQRLLTPSAARIAGNVATVAFAVVILLQLLLAAGVLPISMAWGGTQAVLTVPFRVASVVAAAVLGLCAYVIRRRAGLVGEGPPSRATRVFSWVITVYMGLNTVGNLASSSKWETIVFAPLTLVLLLSCLIVSLSKLE
jgi:hypothetical protein